jgi:hypothetical protein
MVRFCRDSILEEPAAKTAMMGLANLRRPQSDTPYLNDELLARRATRSNKNQEFDK